MSKINEFLQKSDSGLIKLDELDVKKAWKIAKDVVDYPVYILNAFYKNENNEFVNANGETNTGRGKHFNLIVVDKLRNGDKQVISAVTGQYGSVVTTDVYSDFQKQLIMSEQKHKLINVYVSGNGGTQNLIVEMEDMLNLDCVPDAVVMRIRLDTSVDSTKSHTLSMLVHNKTGNVSSVVYGGEYRLSARHTNTINERTIDFIPSLNKMINNWNELIMPTMNLMYDRKFEKKMAMELINGVAKEAGIGERHRENIKSLYESDKVRTNDKTHSLYRINITLDQYVEDELGNKKELQVRFKNGIAKSIHKHLKK